MRFISSSCTFILLFTLSSLGQLPPKTRQESEQACIASLSGFPKGASLIPKPPFPSDSNGITLEYFASECLGNCPAFTLTISENVARFDGHAYVRAKGKRTAKLTHQEFEGFLHAWYEGNFYAMRDNYCGITCPDGTQILVLDNAESSIRLTTPTFTKQVYECFSTVNNQPQTPKPPEQYYDLVRQLWAFAKAKHWL